ncbi:MAG TPA: NAD(P)H-binding protein [Candidatus Acidoferrales bacterium]|nr:NAD(P)H-binding protein [Candidatus Acidoferrales bacterium]
MSTIVITGALSYTGKYTTQLLLSRGYKIRTLTFHPRRPNPFGEQIEVFPYHFDDPDKLKETLLGASVLINTYWVRFPRGGRTFESAVENTRTLIRAAKDAGLRRIVHVSIANPSLDSPLGYYRGKAQLEEAVRESGLSYAIVRPTVIFGLEDILINNIAWFVRRFPLFGIPGDGRYHIRPIYVEDIARLLADAVEGESSTTVDAVGPQSFTFDELVQLIATKIGRPIRLAHLPVPVSYVFTTLAGWFLGDVVLTWQEYRGLTGDLLGSKASPVGDTRLSQWLAANHDQVGRYYASEVARHFTRP